MLDSGESRKEVIRPDFNRAIMIDFQGAKITSVDYKIGRRSTKDLLNILHDQKLAR
jgi:trehalose-6-phosphatase